MDGAYSLSDFSGASAYPMNAQGGVFEIIWLNFDKIITVEWSVAKAKYCIGYIMRGRSPE